MSTQLTRVKDRISALRGDRGATDPILVIAAIAVTLVLLVGGSFVVSKFITSGQDLNAKSDLDKVSVAEQAVFSTTDTYVKYARTKAGVESGDDADPNTTGTQYLSAASVGFTATQGGSINVTLPTTTLWVAASQSLSGKQYVRSSKNAQSFEYSTAMAASDLTQMGITQAQAKAAVDGLG